MLGDVVILLINTFGHNILLSEYNLLKKFFCLIWGIMDTMTSIRFWYIMVANNILWWEKTEKKKKIFFNSYTMYFLKALKLWWTTSQKWKKKPSFPKTAELLEHKLNICVGWMVLHTVCVDGKTKMTSTTQGTLENC